MQSSEWMRTFFHVHRFQSVKDLMDSALRGGITKTFVEWVLQLRRRLVNRRSVDDVVRLHRYGVPRFNRWFRPFLRSLWSLYLTMQSLSVRKVHGTEAPTLHRMTMSQRVALAGSTIVHLRREPRRQRASAKLR